MKNNCFLRTALIGALLLLGYGARCQNAVLQACRLDSLYRQLEGLRQQLPAATDSGRYEKITDACQKFFQILVSNDTSLVAPAAAATGAGAMLPKLSTLQQHYQHNPLLRSEVQVVISWWSEALDKNKEEKKKFFTGLIAAEMQRSSAQLWLAYRTKRIAELQQDTAKILQALRRKSRATQDLPQGDSSRATQQEAQAAARQLYEKYGVQLTTPATNSFARELLVDLEMQVNQLLAREEMGTVASLQKFRPDVNPGPQDQINTKRIRQLLSDSSKAWTEFHKSLPRLKEWERQLNAIAENCDPPNIAVLIDQATIAPPANFSVATVGLPSPSPLLAESGRQPRASTGSLQGAVIAGTADFLVGRFKQEMNAAFFQHFATLLHDTTYAELGVLFPSTARLLTSGVATYGTLVQTLRGAFEQDLRELLFNYGELMRRQKFYKRQLIGQPEVEQAVRYSYLATRTLYYLGHGTHPADLLTYLDNDIETAFEPELDAQLLALRNTLAMLQVLSGALLAQQPLARAWLTTTYIAPRLRDPRTQRFFAGLVWQRLSSQERARQAADQRAARVPAAARAAAVRARAAAGFYQQLLAQTDNGARFQQMLLGFVSLTTQLQNQAQRLQKRTAADTAGTIPLRAADFVPLFQLVQQGLTFVTECTLPADQRGVGSGGRTGNKELFSKLSTALIQGYVAADRGDYGVTISNFLEVVLLTLRSPGHAETATSAGTLASTQAAQTTLLSLPQIVRYGTFMAALAQARSTADVQQALEAAALPVGSSSVKRRSFSTLSLNAFVGGSGGLERTFKPAGSEAPVATPWRAALGFSAPVGLAFSWGWHRAAQSQRVRWVAHPSDVRAKRLRRLDQAYRYYGADGAEQYLTGSAFSLFASVIDLGVPVLLRLSDSQTGAVPRNIDFRHVFAPGIFVVHGFRNTPLSAFAGVQFTPQLRQLADTTGLRGAPAPFLNSLRINAGITIDIPIFTLFNRTESRQPTPGRLVIERTQRAAAVQLETLHYLRQPALTQARCQAMQAALAARRTQLDALMPAQGLTGEQGALFTKAHNAVHQRLRKAQKIMKKYPAKPKLMGSFIKRIRLRRIALHLLKAEQQYVVVQRLNRPDQGLGATGNKPDGKVQELPASLKGFPNATTP